MVACSDEPKSEKDNTKTDKTVVNEELKNALHDTTNPLNLLHPSNLSPDRSWMIDLDTREGNLLSYTIQYQSGESVTKEIDKTIPVTEEVDYSQGKFINDTTYQMSNIGGSKKGHFELYIFKDASFKYIEHEITR